MRFPTIQIQVESGVRLAVEAGAPSDGPVTILSNSIGSDFGMWDEFKDRMSGTTRIIRYDTRGHGRSDMGSAGVTIERLGLDVIAMLDTLEVEQAVFCGLSLGGLTGQWLGANYPERFHGIILANTAANFPPPDLWIGRARSVRTSGMQQLVSPTIDRWLSKNFQSRHSERTSEIATMIASTPAEGYARCCELLAHADLTSLLANIAVPVLVICGEHDPSTPPARGAELVDAIPRADLIVLDAAHVSAIEAADEFAAAARKFIDDVTTRPIKVAGRRLG